MRMAFALSALLSITGANAVLASNLVANGSFGSTTVKGKERFEGNVDGSSGGGNLTYIAAPGTADDGEGEMSLYGPFPRTSPDGGKFVIADGDEPYRDTIWQTIAGLTIGAVYELNFFQAAGQWAGRPYAADTTESWRVSFGEETKQSDSYNLPFQGVGAWQLEKMRFTATSTSQVLAFLADGTPSGAPPMSLLDGVSLSAVPEPSTWAMMVTGRAAVGGAMRARRSDRRAAALV
ncbi:PEPxxWA-CTERM sorting domain-containing protein [Sphingomonas yunnanensis]|uniref:PEPxxWA-CTERM sorting domain-containing protein n=1 Tax=Sphingomonas yunnanensis TaxID=310400 RepID=UPI001CA666C2|nr:PEPxxWA-CTERM sorting domain-containing protein [Sphingomonas yunnanensis]MBY9061468.1 PEPxxWA-CTERM sorting domain-containing protein [Sphingomonas yunnanensis]